MAEKLATGCYLYHNFHACLCLVDLIILTVSLFHTMYLPAEYQFSGRLFSNRYCIYLLYHTMLMQVRQSKGQILSMVDCIPQAVFTAGEILMVYSRNVRCRKINSPVEYTHLIAGRNILQKLLGFSDSPVLLLDYVAVEEMIIQLNYSELLKVSWLPNLYSLLHSNYSISCVFLLDIWLCPGSLLVSNLFTVGGTFL